ncbi:SCO6745 family protein [Streptosporangium sandarakinum]|uniref:SCO6745 family protein n=1 Tax=Streptosporangium sandarakinum TaxID=1260955 RepID=UPI003684D993
MGSNVPRMMWQLLEPLHAVTYFAPEARSAADAAGMRGFWMGYFATRAAPLGAVGPEVVTAAFHGFPPARVARALPDAWGFASPEAVLRARLDGAGAALRRLLAGAAAPGSPEGAGSLPDAPEKAGSPADVPEKAGPLPDVLEEAGSLAWEAARRADTAGRVLAAANQALPEPAEPYLRLWQAATTLREHRGDGHVAVLVACGVSPVEAHLLKIAAAETGADGLRLARKWDEAEWDAALGSLRARGWLDGAGRLTGEGARERDRIERLTDEAAAGPWRALGEESTATLARLLWPLANAVMESGVFPVPNPVGMPWPPEPVDDLTGGPVTP